MSSGLRLHTVLIAGTTGLVGGLIAGVFVLPFLVKGNLFGTAAIFNKLPNQSQTVITKIEEKPVFIPQPNYFSEATDKINPRVVAIQSFSGGILLRSGSGIILTQDGLIATLNSLVPANTQLVQVVNGNKIYSGRIVFRSYNKNLAIISIADSGLQTAKFKLESPALGQDILAFAKTVNFNKDSPLVTGALISQVNADSGQFKIIIPYDQFIYGSALINSQAEVLGLLDFRNQKPIVVTSKLIEETLSSALTKSSKAR